MKKMGILILGLFVHSVALANVYNCGKMPETQTKIFINDGGWPAKKQNVKMGVQLQAGKAVVLSEWFPVEKGSSFLQAQVSVGTGTYYIFNLQKIGGQTKLQLTEVFYDPQPDGTVVPEYTPYPVQNCTSL